VIIYFKHIKLANTKQHKNLANGGAHIFLKIEDYERRSSYIWVNAVL